MPDEIASTRIDLSGKKARRGRPKAADGDAIPMIILNAALLLFRKQGLAATSIEQIAAAAGASKTTIYRHFGSKEALAEAAVELDGRNVLLAVGTADISDPDPLVRLRKVVFAIGDFAALPTSADLYRFSISAVPSVPAVGRAFAHTADGLRAMMLPHLLAAQSAGALRGGDANHLASQLYNAVVSPVWSDALLMMDYVRDDASRREAMEQNWDAFLRGGHP